MTPDAAPARRPRWPVVALAVVVLAACFVYATSRAEVPTGGGHTVTYVVEGGFMGGRRVLTVSAEGEATLDRDAVAAASWQIDAQRVEELHAALDAARFDALDAEYRPGTCMDCFVETITYRGHSVTVEGVAAPDGLSDVLALLDDIAARR